MASYSFDDVRQVSRLIGFLKIRSHKHDTWRKTLADGTILLVRLSHKHGQTVPRWLFHEILRQAGLSEANFRQLLGRKN